MRGLKLPDYRQEFWRNQPDWERERIEAMLKVVKEGDTIIDVGAEMGDITALLARAAGDNGTVWAVECVGKMWPTIRYIFEQNNLKTPNCFVGFAGNETKNDAEYALLSGSWPGESEGELLDEPGFQHLNERYDLPTIKIDDMIKPTEKVDVITMDVEGSEFEVIKGATETIKRNKPVIFISIHPAFMDERYQQQAEDLIRYIKDLGYSSQLISIDHETHVEFKPL